MYFFTVLRLMPSFLAICRWVSPFFFSTNISKTVSFFSMRHLAHAEIKETPYLFLSAAPPPKWLTF